ncbi:MAG TPA: efflux RND transporter periplasmic adaptor subunit [Terriglobales bacterium]|nr:efflux RND transporter periplasmic adaptor subunit [Terriglobales bacterium]
MSKFKIARGATLALTMVLATGFVYRRQSRGAPPAAPAAPPLVPIQLTPQRMQNIGVATGVVRRAPVSQDIRTVGNVVIDEQLLSTVYLRFTGWIQKVFVDSTYAYVRQGQPLFTIYSPDLVTTEQEYVIAQKNRQAVATSPVPGVAAGAATLAEAALARLQQWQIPAREIARLQATGQPERQFEIDSPAAGYVTVRNALPNAYAQPQTELYAIAGLSTVWVNAELYQDQLAGVALGDAANVTVDTFPGRVFHGRVDFIYPTVNPATRTVRVRFALPNPKLDLKPGMFVNVNLHQPMGTRLVIPTSGVLQTGTRQIAFVERGNGYFEPREVQLGPMVGDNYVVLSGLRAGERIVTSANFLIDSESQLQAALGAFTPPPPGAGAAAAMNQPAAQIAFTTNPTPPRKGSDTFRVRLTGADHRPIAGAAVVVTFSMAAMPAMGMAARRQQFTLADQGGGDYQGEGELPTDGAWQVTIVARQAGHVVASRQLALTVAGGM